MAWWARGVRKKGLQNLDAKELTGQNTDNKWLRLAVAVLACTARRLHDDALFEFYGQGWMSHGRAILL
jgi:hypothetical protein